MRLSPVIASALYSSAVFLGQTQADALDDVPESSATSVAESATSSIIEKPTVTPSDIKGAFLEQFTDDWDSRWAPSHAKKEDSKADEEWAYVGSWAVEEATVLKGIHGDQSLVVANPAAHHAISAKFNKKIDNKGKTLVIQYEVKLQNGLEYGGAYLKLLQDKKKLHAEEFSNASPYVIMFGPDKCGATNKVHFIFKHKNPKTGEYEEKHLKNAPPARITKASTLYTLIVNPDQTFLVKVDGEEVKKGSLLEDFSPAVNPEKEIDDPKDVKPEDWVDEARIPDPEATKPEDWDEYAPYEIVHEEATKPEDWLEDEATTIPDPEAAKPEDWDDEEDGDWVPRFVLNPKCEDVSGCGKWGPTTKKTPLYKGKWTPEYIDNPAYKGVWKHKKIPNPNYFEDKTPANFEPIGAIAFEIWTMQNNFLFDNIYIGHSVEAAEKLKAETYDIKRTIEDAEDEASKPKPSESPKSPGDLNFLDDPVLYVRERVQLFLTIAMDNPIEAIEFVPDVAGGAGLILATVVALIFGALGLSGASPPPQIKKASEDFNKAALETLKIRLWILQTRALSAALDAKDKIVDSANSGAGKVQAGQQEIN